MCVIAICVEKKPDLETMRKCFHTNDDGCAIITMKDNRKVEYIKGINDVRQLVALVEKATLPFILHFRLQSIGAHHALLTHPFEISKDSPLHIHNECNRCLVHNGTEPNWKFAMSAAGLKIPLEKDGKTETLCSDSRAIAMIISQHKNNEFLRGSTGAQGKFVDIGYHNKDDENWIRYYGDFDEEDGIIFSNLKWQWDNTYHYRKWEGDETEKEPVESGDKKKDKKSVRVSSKSFSEEVLTQDQDGKLIYRLKPYRLMPRKERADYRKFWDLHAPYQSEKYPVALPPNTVTPPKPQEISVVNRPYNYSKEEQEFLNGRGNEGFIGGEWY